MGGIVLVGVGNDAPGVDVILVRAGGVNNEPAGGSAVGVQDPVDAAFVVGVVGRRNI